MRGLFSSSLCSVRKRKRNADRRGSRLRTGRVRRVPLSLVPPPFAEEAFEGARSPVGVPPRLSPRGLTSPQAQLRPCFLGGGLTHDPEKWKPVFRKDHAQAKNRLRALPAFARPSPVSTSRTVVSAGMMPEPAGERAVSSRPRPPHPLRIPEYLRERRP